MLYDVDDRDRVRVAPDLPWPEAAAPMPRLVQDENRAVVVYFVSPLWPGRTQGVQGSVDGDRVALVTFDMVLCCVLGPPNDEAFACHPLARRGLEPYRSFAIEDSSMIRKLERRNAVHPAHDPVAFLARWRHFGVAFHDATLEVVANRFRADVRGAGGIDWDAAAMAALKR